jgi:hypothetical protein
MDFFKAIQNLPEHEPRPDLWDRIDADLRADARIDRALDDLPVFEPKADSWAQIAGHLEKPVIRSLRLSSWWVAAAASVALAVGLWFFLQPNSDEKVSIAYATEPVETELTITPEPLVSSADLKAETFINEQCAQQTVVCQKLEVKELKQQLRELSSRKEAVAQELLVFGNDPALVQAQIKIENEQAEVTKELVRILTI